MICCDTSFLFSLYGEDVHSARAVEWVSGCSSALSLTALNLYELRNALNFSGFKGFYSDKEVLSYRGDFEAALLSDRLVLCQPNLAEVIQSSTELSDRYTRTSGHRSFDILHVAAAKVLEASTFLSFDKNQNRLAGHAGFERPFAAD